MVPHGGKPGAMVRLGLEDLQRHVPSQPQPANGCLVAAAQRLSVPIRHGDVARGHSLDNTWATRFGQGGALQLHRRYPESPAPASNEATISIAIPDAIDSPKRPQNPKLDNHVKQIPSTCMSPCFANVREAPEAPPTLKHSFSMPQLRSKADDLYTLAVHESSLECLPHCVVVPTPESPSEACLMIVNPVDHTCGRKCQREALPGKASHKQDENTNELAAKRPRDDSHACFVLKALLRIVGEIVGQGWGGLTKRVHEPIWGVAEKNKSSQDFSIQNTSPLAQESPDESLNDLDNAQSNTSGTNSDLFDLALCCTPTPSEAKHPGRSSGGLVLLRCVREKSRFDHCRSIDIVERMFFDSIPKDCVEIRQIDEVVQPAFLDVFLQRMAESASSVEATFHGTREEHVKNILEQGLLPDLCTTGAYGSGAYVGTHAGVAHQYADPDAVGNRHMCVVLAIVGNELVKGRNGVQAKVTAADDVHNPTQYCFVDASRLLVSHAITYAVTNTMCSRVGGGWDDPFQRQLSKAVARAAKVVNKAGML